ncbi:hypothetical protein SCALM49S_02901 [Streptomyces californicus]
MPGQAGGDAGFGGLRLPELRTLRRDAQRDEADLSYVRRLVQGRIDILRAELARRHGPEAPVEDAAVVSRLPEILADTPSRHRTSARHVTLTTPRGDEFRRLAAETLAEVELSDLDARTDEELHTPAWAGSSATSSRSRAAVTNSSAPPTGAGRRSPAGTVTGKHK